MPIETDLQAFHVPTKLQALQLDLYASSRYAPRGVRTWARELVLRFAIWRERRRSEEG